MLVYQRVLPFHTFSGFLVIAGYLKHQQYEMKTQLRQDGPLAVINSVSYNPYKWPYKKKGFTGVISPRNKWSY